jgi:HEAT repeat protein
MILPSHIPAELIDMIEGLTSKDDAIRIEAAFHLKQLGEKAAPAVPYLMEILDDRSQVKWPPLDRKTSPAEQAFEALVNTGEPAVMPLVTTLEHPDPAVRESAARALGKLKDERATEPLARALMDERSHFQKSAPPRPISVTEERRGVKPRVRMSERERYAREASALRHKRAAEEMIMALGMTGDVRALEALEAARDHCDLRLESEACRAMAALGKPSLEPLLAALKHGSVRVRAGAAEGLGGLEDLRALEPLLAAATEDAFAVRRKAIRALGALKHPDALKPLIDVFRGPHAKLREEAAGALRSFGEAAIPVLTDSLSDEDPEARAKAVQLLGSLKDSRAVEPLLLALDDADGTVRSSAARYLGDKKDRRAIGPLIATLKDREAIVRRTAVPSLASMGRPAVRPLIAAMKDEHPLVRANAACALGGMGDPRATEQLIGALIDDDFEVRNAAAWALGRLTDEASVEKLAACLQGGISDTRVTDFQGLCETEKLEIVVSHLLGLRHGSSGVRKRAAQALGEARLPCAAKPLIRALGDRDRGVQKAAVHSLLELGNHAIRSLIAALTHERSAVRNWAAWALEEIEDVCAHMRLLPGLQHEDSRVRSVIAAVLGARQEKGRDSETPVYELIAVLEDPDAGVRRNAARSLGRVRPGSRSLVIQPLIDVLKDKDPSVRRTAAGSLARFGSLPVVPLMKVLAHEHPHVREGAAWALGEIGSRYSMAPLIATLKDEHSAVRSRAAEALLSNIMREIDNEGLDALESRLAPLIAGHAKSPKPSE